MRSIFRAGSSVKGSLLMQIGAISIFIGALIMWQYSLPLGGLALAFGVFMIGRQYMTPDERPDPGRSYRSEATSYDISSKPRR